MLTLKRLLVLSIILTMWLTLLSGFVIPKTSALSGSDFTAGRIIDDAVFFNPNSMTVQEIQTFLNAKVPVCDTSGSGSISGTSRANYGTSRGYPPPYICLKDYVQTIPNRAADAYCFGSVVGGTKSAAQIISDVAQACSVSPKILLVLLQKEQSLVTDDWPWSVQYEKATGYACPDTAPCSPEFAGFFNQIYYAARQYQRYVKQSHLFNFTAGQNNNIQYNPNASCGSSSVFIQNQATAGLYNYTPYQPNQAALNNLYGTGDSCSAYGNRNFWRMYIDWFGSPLSTVPYAWMYEGQSAFSDSSRTQPFTSVPTVVPGGKIYVRVRARNMGTQSWNKSFLHLGTSKPQDRASLFVDSSWFGLTRPAELKETSIAPGQIGTFEFTMQAPNNTGTYNEYFNVVADGITWLNDLGLFFTINVNTANSPLNSINTSLPSGGSINKDQQLLSQDAQSTLSMVKDSLTLSTNFSPAWTTGPLGGLADRLVMQTDGNLVLYDKNNKPLWNSETQGNPGAWCALQTDGNLVVYSSTNSPLWATYTIHNPDLKSYINTFLKSGIMYAGQQLQTADKKYRLVFQRDGNVVLYSATRALWATGTDGKPSLMFAMQPDGNLVLYDKNFVPLWYSRTAGFANLRLVVQPDGNLVIYGPTGKAYWHTMTHGQQ